MKASDEWDPSYRNHQIASLAEELIGFGFAEEAFKILVAYFRPAENDEYSALGASEPFIDSVFILYKRRGLPHVLAQLRGSVSILTESTVLERVVARYVDPLGEDKALEVALAIRKPDFRAKAFAAIGKYLARSGQYEHAERVAHRISELMRDHAEVRFHLAEVAYVLLGRNAFLSGPYGWDDNLHLFRERDEELFPNDVRGDVPDF